MVGCGDKPKMQITKPYYYLNFKINNCPRLVAINGFSVDEGFSGDANYGEYPINHLIKNGTNKLEMLIGDQETMVDFLDETSNCQVEVKVRGTIDGKDVDYLVTDINYTPKYTENWSDLTKDSRAAGRFSFDNNNQTTKVEQGGEFSVDTIKKGSIYFEGVGENFSREFEAVVPFSEWAFFSGDQIILPPINEDYNNKGEQIINPEIDRIIGIFESRDIQKILPYFELRSHEFDQAFYKTPGDTQADIERSLGGIFSRDLPLYKISDKNFQLIASFDGRLITRVDAGNREGTVYFDDEETGSSTFYTIYWMRKNGQWIIAR